MPFDDDSVAVFFAEHVFEDFSLVAGERDSCSRAGGACRQVGIADRRAGCGHVPPSSPRRGDWAELVSARPLAESQEGYRDFWLKLLDSVALFTSRWAFQNRAILPWSRSESLYVEGVK